MTRGRKLLLLGSMGLALVPMFGCSGGSSNNDQGTSFQAFGYFSANTASGAVSTTRVTNATALINSDIALISVTTSAGTINADGQLLEVSIGLENRLRDQFIRVTRVDCEYEVPGASIPIQSDSYVVGGVIPAAPTIAGPQIPVTPSTGGAGGATGGTGGTTGGTGGTTGGTGGSTGGTGGTGGASGGSGGIIDTGSTTGTRDYFEFSIVTPDLFSFLNVNRNSLPEAPFRMVANCAAVGVTQGGDSLTTNPLGFTVQFVEAAEGPTGDAPGGFQGEDGGTGGDFDGTDSSGTTLGGADAITNEDNFTIE